MNAPRDASRFKNPLFIGFSLISLPVYIGISYYTPRANFWQFIGLYLLLFGGYFAVMFRLLRGFESPWISYLFRKTQTSKKTRRSLIPEISLGRWLSIAILLRLSLIFLSPNLTDDYFRYIWDGRLLNHGVNPFMYLPSELLEHSVYTQAHLNQLYDGLNSANYFSVYPPTDQLIFYISTALQPNDILGSIVIMRLFYIVFEMGTIFFLVKLLGYCHLAKEQVLIYALNPMIILEFTGNLHQEVSMLFFLLASIYALVRHQFLLAAFCLATSINTKLIPIAFAPLFFFQLLRNHNLLTALRYAFYTIIFFALPYIPFMNWTLIEKMGSSIGLYFGNFEFNGSIFYLLKKGLTALLGRNETYLSAVSTVLPLISLGIILKVWYQSYWWSNQKLIYTWILVIVSAYYFLASTVHPWYISTLIMTAVFVPVRFPLLWSCVGAFSYITYQTSDYAENYYLILIEYIMVYICLIHDLQNANARILFSTPIR